VAQSTLHERKATGFDAPYGLYKWLSPWYLCKTPSQREDSGAVEVLASRAGR